VKVEIMIHKATSKKEMETATVMKRVIGPITPPYVKKQKAAPVKQQV